GLRELGWIEGSNVTIVYRSANGALASLPTLAAELVGRRPDVIVASSNTAIIALMRETRSIPIVISIAGDPVGAGFVTDLAHPGGNVTGLSNVAEQLSAKRLELLKEIDPRISRIGVFRNPSIPTHAVLLRETAAAADVLRWKVSVADVRSADDYE